MAKPDPALLDPARYPFHCRIEPRFGDLDTNMHLNNVALAGILEDARVRFHRASGYHAAIAKMTSMVVSFATEYLGQAYFPQPLDIHVAATEIGRTSYVIQQLTIQEDRIVNFARAVMVCVAGDRPAPIPAAFAEGMTEWMLRPCR